MGHFISACCLSVGCRSGLGWSWLKRSALAVTPAQVVFTPGTDTCMVLCIPSPPACQESRCQAHVASRDGIQPGREHSLFLFLFLRLLLLYLFGCVVGVSGFIIYSLALLTGSVRVHLPHSVPVGTETHHPLINLNTFSSRDHAMSSKAVGPYQEDREAQDLVRIRASLKGIVHPKMIILSLFTQPNVIANLHDFYMFSGTQNKTSQWSPKQISSIVFCRINKVMQVWNNMRVNKLWQNCHFGVNYPFNHYCLLNDWSHIEIARHIHTHMHYIFHIWSIFSFEICTHTYQILYKHYILKLSHTICPPRAFCCQGWPNAP